MAHEAHLIIENKERQLLTFKMDYFKVQNSILDKWAYTTINDTLDSLSDASRSSLSSFYSKDAIPFGGFFNLTMETTSDDSWLYEWFLPDESSSTMVKHGRIDFYGDDEFYPFKRIEFWDAWIPNISEAMCSTGTNSMIMSLQLMPATIRYNNEEVHRKVWYITDIDKKAKNVVSEERELFVTDIKWRGRKKDYISSVYRKDMMLNHNLTLEVEVKNHLPGDSFELQVKQSNGRRIKGQGSEFTVTGHVNDEGNIILIENFKVECDFAEDNQNFGNIEFYHKGRKVAEFKENFGWTWIKEGGKLKIFVNTEVTVAKLATGCTLDDYKPAINEQFKRTLELSSNGLVTGKIFFSGTFMRELPQLVPQLHFDEKRKYQGTNLFFMGNHDKGRVEVLTEAVDNDYNLMDIGETAIHELFHSLRLDHPFERTVGKDTKLVMDLSKTDAYLTTPETNPLIYWNIMNYDDITINGKLLKNLHKTRRPELITNGQLRVLFSEIEKQRNGSGVIDGTDITAKDGVVWSNFEYYWEEDYIGAWVHPKRFKYNEPEIL
ncbi:MAG: hypothetical protein LBV71_16785 [Prevotella sp.]|jgi:hypothetical protein|nr:hypothetical protein [Prevotella sp.]